MSTRFLKRTWPGVLLLGVIPMPMGGWAVTTVEDFPDHVIAGRPVTLTYRVRQHGVELLDGLNGHNQHAFFVIKLHDNIHP